jgi:hypothetical protein
MPISTRPNRAFFDYDLDRAYMHSLILEHQETIAGSFVLYFAIDERSTQYDVLYDESIGPRIFMPPVKVHAMIEYKGQEQTNAGAYTERVKSIGLKVFKTHLQEVQLSDPKSGDIVQVGSEYFELTNAVSGNPMYGDMNDLVAFEWEARQARAFDVSQLPKVGVQR